MMLRYTLMMVALAALAGCSKHDCDLSSEADQKAFGEVAEMTKGAHSCMVSNNELIATHPDVSVTEVADKYKAFLESKSWKVELKDHKGERANGKPLEGKVLLAQNGDKKSTTLVYPLADTIIETVTSTE